MTYEKKEPTVSSRRFLGIVTLAGGRAIPQAYALYEERYSDGSYKLCKGYSIHTSPGFSLLNPKGRTKKQRKWDKDEYHPNLFTEITAAAVLNDHIAAMCRWLDNERDLKEF